MTIRRYQRGDVVWSIEPFWPTKRAKEAIATGNGAVEIDRDDVKPRPCVILSDCEHPFYPKQYLVAGITTTDWLISHPLKDRYWTRGGIPKDSYVSPWCVYPLSHSHIIAPPAYDTIDDPYIGRLVGWFVEMIADDTITYLPKPIATRS